MSLLTRGYDRTINTVVLDLAPHPVGAWAVVYHGKLLPIRFATDDEGFLHLREMLAETERREQRASQGAAA